MIGEIPCLAQRTLHPPGPSGYGVSHEGGKYHIGIATDGDSDRIGLYDELGNIDANEILKLLYFYLKEYRQESGGLVRNLTTTHILIALPTPR